MKRTTDGPSTADLREIERETPLIEAEIAVLDAEIAILRAGSSVTELDHRRLRRAKTRAARQMVAFTAATSFDDLGGAA